MWSSCFGRGMRARKEANEGVGGVEEKGRVDLREIEEGKGEGSEERRMFLVVGGQCRGTDSPIARSDHPGRVDGVLEANMLIRRLNFG
jgi:hypothetical protein